MGLQRDLYKVSLAKPNKMKRDPEDMPFEINKCPFWLQLWKGKGCENRGMAVNIPQTLAFHAAIMEG